MNTNTKIILIPILMILLTMVFIILDMGVNVNSINQLIQPLIFACSATFCILYASFRRYVLIISSIILLLMVFAYLLNMLNLSNWLGSLGFGLLFIAIFSYLPQLVRKGFVERY